MLDPLVQYVMNEKNSNRFEILRLLAVAGSQGDQLNEAARAALEMAAHSVGLVAAAIHLWDDDSKGTVSLSYAENEPAQEQLVSLEEGLFDNLRQERQLLSAYMSFGGERPRHSFTLPLRQGNKVFGAVIGLQEGDRTIISEDTFLEALSALLALTYAAQGAAASIPATQDLVDKERLAAIIETAVAVNHEVNNPLTAILGNVQLLLMKSEELDAPLAEKLRTIEASAMKIRDVTQRLMRMTNPKTVEYTNGTKMLDISGDDEESE